MLGKPHNGWSHVTIGYTEIGIASYTTDVPIDALDAFLKWFASEDNYRSKFELVFDGEGYYFGLCMWNHELYYVIDGEHTHMHSAEKTLGGNTIQCMIFLAEQVANDIRTNIDDWVAFSMNDDVDASVLKYSLLEACDRLDKLIAYEEKYGKK